MSIAAAPALEVEIGLLAGCGGRLEHCREMAAGLKRQLDPAYSRGAAIMPLAYWQAGRTARKRRARAERLGYEFGYIDRAAWVDDIYAINTSAPERQGRPMSPGYQERPSYGPNPMACPWHHVYPYGVRGPDGRLAAYLWLYCAGELLMVSSILGHAERLADDVMYLLFLGMVERHSSPTQALTRETVFYNLWRSGGDGLRYYKARVGLREGRVKWRL